MNMVDNILICCLTVGISLILFLIWGGGDAEIVNALDYYGEHVYEVRVDGYRVHAYSTREEAIKALEHLNERD
tara:strand:+ start:635 stop:853 length:219 start_codon:yes stop_codon:yes gene_type:complete